MGAVLLFTLSSCFLNALSLILMKYSMEKSDKRNYSMLNRWWLTGFLCLILATLANVMALRYGTLVVLASASALTILFNSILSVYILGERLTKWDIVAMILIMGGSISCMTVSKSSDEGVTKDEMFDKLTSLSSILYFSIAALYIGFAFLYDSRIRNTVLNEWIKITSRCGTNS